jgi:hypothetical protein
MTHSGADDGDEQKTIAYFDSETQKIVILSDIHE